MENGLDEGKAGGGETLPSKRQSQGSQGRVIGELKQQPWCISDGEEEMDSKLLSCLSQVTFVISWMWGQRWPQSFSVDLNYVAVIFTKRVTTWSRKSIGGRRGRSPVILDTRDVPRLRYVYIWTSAERSQPEHRAIGVGESVQGGCVDWEKNRVKRINLPWKERWRKWRLQRRLRSSCWSEPQESGILPAHNGKYFKRVQMLCGI